MQFSPRRFRFVSMCSYSVRNVVCAYVAKNWVRLTLTSQGEAEGAQDLVKGTEHWDRAWRNKPKDVDDAVKALLLAVAK